ncbi:MAG: hypothetical protein ACR2RV_07670, partial [Verrucomicrobiales bacterium]
MKLPLIRTALALAGIVNVGAAPVTTWVATNGDAGFSGGSEATDSPVTTSADADTIVGSFPAITLAVGDSVELRGNIVVSGTGSLPGNQLRWGLFDAPGQPTTGVGGGYAGVWAAAAAGSADLRRADGSTTNPFSSSAAIAISSASDPDGGVPDFGESLSFTLTVTRLGATQINTSATLTDGSGFRVEWPETSSPASPDNFTYDSVGILLGGTLDSPSAALTSVSVDLISAPVDSDRDGMPDDYELANGLNPEVDDAALDLDGDSLTNISEFRGADGSPGTGDETSPNDEDSDADGSRDDHELTRGTDPNNPDTDGDTLLDGAETGTGVYVGEGDTGTDPLQADSDGDSADDGFEIDVGTDPNDPDSNFSARVLGIDFNRGDCPGAPTYSGVRTVSGSATQADNPTSLAKQIGAVSITLATGDGSALEFRGANGDASRTIPGGDLSRAFLVSDFAGSRSGSLRITLSGLPAGTYLWTSYHLDP